MFLGELVKVTLSLHGIGEAGAKASKVGSLGKVQQRQGIWDSQGASRRGVNLNCQEAKITQRKRTMFIWH